MKTWTAKQVAVARRLHPVTLGKYLSGHYGGPEGGAPLRVLANELRDTVSWRRLPLSDCVRIFILGDLIDPFSYAMPVLHAITALNYVFEPLTDAIVKSNKKLERSAAQFPVDGRGPWLIIHDPLHPQTVLRPGHREKDHGVRVVPSLEELQRDPSESASRFIAVDICGATLRASLSLTMEIHDAKRE